MGGTPARLRFGSSDRARPAATLPQVWWNGEGGLVMGTWQNAAAVGYLPVPAEIQSGKDWLAGAIPPERVHWH